jgi:hypothetical protein
MWFYKFKFFPGWFFRISSVSLKNEKLEMKNSWPVKGLFKYVIYLNK